MILLQATSYSDTAIVGILAIVASAATNWAVMTRATARFEGATQERFKAHQQRIEAVEEEQRDQWKQINQTRADVAGVQSRCDARHLNGYKKGAGA